MLKQLEAIYKEALAKLKTVNSTEALHEWEIQHLGKKGAVTLMLRSTGQLLLNPAQAQQEAQDYLAALGQVAQSITVAGDTISVTVALTVAPVLLPTGAITVNATESATAITEEP